MTADPPTPPRRGEPLETAPCSAEQFAYLYGIPVDAVEMRDAAMKLAGEAAGMEKLAEFADELQELIDEPHDHGKDWLGLTASTWWWTSCVKAMRGIRASQAPQDETKGGTE